MSFGMMVSKSKTKFPLVPAGFLVCFYLVDLPAFRGIRIVATMCLLIAFAFSALPYTYFQHFGYKVHPVHPACRLRVGVCLAVLLSWLASYWSDANFILTVILPCLASSRSDADDILTVDLSCLALACDPGSRQPFMPIHCQHW